ncbi:DUF2782 domain-containing protein [Azonexus sp. IMCC34839]|uniref:DUF2782 domain-containing protein n=1 Tax=Azonexus sp. IMCC34839 TaxID=3133695 RepID=UPI00399994D3
MRRLLPVLLFAALPVWAQKGDLQPLPAVPPPPPEMEAFDAALEPQVTIVKKEAETREEYRIKGKLYMVKVTPSIGKPYYLIDRQGDGKFVEADIAQNPVRPPMWVIYSW